MIRKSLHMPWVQFQMTPNLCDHILYRNTCLQHDSLIRRWNGLNKRILIKCVLGKTAENYLHKNAIASAHKMHRQKSITHCNDWIFFFSFAYIIMRHLRPRFKSKWDTMGMAPIIWFIKEINQNLNNEFYCFTEN